MTQRRNDNVLHSRSLWPSPKLYICFAQVSAQGLPMPGWRLWATASSSAACWPSLPSRRAGPCTPCSWPISLNSWHPSCGMQSSPSLWQCSIRWVWRLVGCQAKEYVYSNLNILLFIHQFPTTSQLWISPSLPCFPLSHSHAILCLTFSS